MYTDTAQITTVTRNAKTGAETRGTPFTVKCFWEESERLLYRPDGTSWRRENLYMFPPGTAIKEGDYVKPLTRNGKAVSGVDAKIQNCETFARGIAHIEAST